MDLKEQIEQQYRKRAEKAHLYVASEYTRFVQKEWVRTAADMLKLYGKNISDLSVIEIGAGSGANVPLLEELGFKVSNMSFNELLDERVKILKEKFPNNMLYAGNAIDLDFPQRYDVVLQSTVFTSILNQSDRQQLADRIWGLLKPGGLLLWYDFIYNNPSNSDVRKVSAQEFIQLFPHAQKVNIRKITLAPPIGRRVGKFYKLFNIPLLRSHILAIAQKV
jgi:SAM-dependent methyltransferase